MQFKYQSISLATRYAKHNDYMQRLNKVVVIVCSDTIDLEYTKYVLDRESTVGKLMYCIRKQCVLNPNEGLFLSHEKMMLSSHHTFLELYDKLKNEDLAIYLTLSKENVFG